MIIVQTPLRISFFGGGTDVDEYSNKYGGITLSTAIDKYVFVIAKERFDKKIVLNYSIKEIVDSIDEIKHSLIREAMKLAGVDNGIEITTLADIPSEGTGLGSSSSITVALLHALYSYKGILVDAKKLAEDACKIEIDILHKPIGRQDQYIAAYGGFKLIKFEENNVKVMDLDLEKHIKNKLNDHLLLLYTGITRNADVILKEQNKVENINKNHELLTKIKDNAIKAKEYLECRMFDDFGMLLNESWQLKKKLSSSVSNEKIDYMYSSAIKADALGGKILGAGGGGFLLLYVPGFSITSVCLEEYRQLPFKFEQDGSKVIFNYRRD